ncbi:MAG: hypothetical protein M9947_12700 [Thermomicrobiales bacterium]|nr:hypothetical protein [Thermomicrobiales bacterium]
MIEAVQTTHAHGLGLYEAVEVVDGGDPNTWPPGSRVISHASDRSMVERLHEAARPPKEPGLIARLLRRR